MQDSLPVITEHLPLLCEVDIETYRTRERFMERSAYLIGVYLRANHKIHRYVYEEREGIPNSCFILDTPSKHIRLKAHKVLGEEIGVCLARCQEEFPARGEDIPARFNPYFDPDWTRDYAKYFSVVCKYSRIKCIRPSHLVLIGPPNGRPLPSLLLSEGVIPRELLQPTPEEIQKAKDGFPAEPEALTDIQEFYKNEQH